MENEKNYTKVNVKIVILFFILIVSLYPVKFFLESRVVGTYYTADKSMKLVLTEGRYFHYGELSRNPNVTIVEDGVAYYWYIIRTYKFSKNIIIFKKEFKRVVAPKSEVQKIDNNSPSYKGLYPDEGTIDKEFSTQEGAVFKNNKIHFKDGIVFIKDSK